MNREAHVISTSLLPGETDADSRSTEKFIREILAHEHVLRACIRRYTRNAADVDELLQETYVRLLKGRATIQGELRSLRAFCLTVARNTSLDWLRHRQIVPIDLQADLDNTESLYEEISTEQVDEIVNSHQELEQIAAIVGQLPPRCREVFTMRRVYGFSQKEIAARMQISENTVEQHLTKASRRCSEALFSSGSQQGDHIFAQLRHRMKRKFGKSA